MGQLLKISSKNIFIIIPIILTKYIYERKLILIFFNTVFDYFRYINLTIIIINR